MGQYYRIAYKNNGVDKIFTNDRKIEGVEYVMAKLMEHSWIGNYLMNAVGKMLQEKVTRLAWVGDYADEKNGDGEEELAEATNLEVCYNDVWGEKSKNGTTFKCIKKFSFRNKYFVNYSKREYISFNKYMKGYKKDEYIINPISLMTVIGNGRGGGDYNGTCMEYVGTWIWDELGIVGKKELPIGFKELDISFKEEY